MRLTALAQQEYTILTFDLSAAKKAWDVVFSSVQYQKVFIRLGVFHTLQAFYAVLGKKMDGSDILLISKICAGGSISKIMKGKHWNRCQ